MGNSAQFFQDVMQGLHNLSIGDNIHIFTIVLNFILGGIIVAAILHILK